MSPTGGGRPALVTVGEFARLTHLTVKTLHHYDDVGLLDPARVDPATGYRYYGLDQLGRAQLIRRLRAVRMPVAQVRDVLAAPDGAARDRLVAEHLHHLRRELAETAAAVATLEQLLRGAWPEVPVTFRDVPDLPCALLTAQVARDGLAAWCAEVYPRLFALAATAPGGVGGPAGALYGTAWFEQARGPVTAFVPLARPGDPVGSEPPDADPAGGAPGLGVVRGGRYAVAVHHGPYQDLDRTYAAVGAATIRARHAVDGPVREVHLVSPADTADPAGLVTQVCWPVAVVPQTEPGG